LAAPPQRRVGCAAVVFLCIGSTVSAVARATPLQESPVPSATDLAIQSEVIGNIRRQPMGRHSVDDLNLPEDFLRRLADRIICASYQATFRVIVRDAAARTKANEAAGKPSPAADGNPQPDDRIVVVERQIPESLQTSRALLDETRPPLRGFKAPILDRSSEHIPFHQPSQAASLQIHQATDVVGERLARDGLLLTLAQVIAILGPEEFLEDDESGSLLLQNVGLPVDLIAFFHPPKDAANQKAITFIAHELAAGDTGEMLKLALQKFHFDFQPTQPGFRLATESGEHDVGMVRVQLTRGSYWEGIGDGGNIDLLRQMIASLPDARFVAAIHQRDLDEFTRLARQWPLDAPGQLTLVPEQLMVGQWAQDNGKPGVIGATDPRANGIATIVPRYASRGDDGSTFVPGESFAIDGLAASGHRVVHSPLLFQGGNLLAVANPVGGERLLLMGEAELHRNMSLGLTRQQVLDAFRIEFGVDRCEVLPSVSFHIDCDLCVRAHNGRPIAFVNDMASAARIILGCGVDVLGEHQVLPKDTIDAAREHLNQDRIGECLDLIAPLILARSDGRGHFPLSLAELFTAGGVDSGVGNFQRFLLALDFLSATTGKPARIPQDLNTPSYHQALARIERSRQALHRRLAELGFDIVAIPGLAASELGIVYVNGIHDRSRYFMPVYGGLYSPLDRAAEQAFHAALGEAITVIPILSSESQRRLGGVHCSCSVYPKL
jgi:hypothetical protein